MTTVSRRNIILLAAAALLLALLSSCYTLFQHPRLASMGYARPGDRCLDCHSQTQLWEFLHTRGSGDSDDAWDQYYDEPWWYHRFLRGDSTSANGSAENGKERL